MAAPHLAKVFVRDLRIISCTPSSTRQLLLFRSRAPYSLRCATVQNVDSSSLRPFSASTAHQKISQSPSSTTPLPTAPKQYKFHEISDLINSPNPKRIIIDVREPGELQSSGRIPTSRNAPLTSSPDFAFLPAEEFEDRFGFPRPGSGDEVIFYCKSGVRSKAAAKLAQQAGFGGVVSEYPGSWKDWEANGGKTETN